MENIILRNLFRLAKAGGFHSDIEDIEPMSAFKWRKLCRVVNAQQLTYFFNEGARLCASQPNCNIPPSLLTACQAEDRYELPNFRKLASDLHLDVPILDKRLHNIIEGEIHAIDTSVETMTMLAIIVDTLNDMLNSDRVMHGVIHLGRYLRSVGDKTDFNKLDRWLNRLMLRRMAQLQGSILVSLFGFEPDEIPFLNRMEPSARRVALRSLDHSQHDVSGEWHFRQSATGMIHNNNAVLRRNLRRSICYINYAPIETIGNFLSKFSHSLSEIEE